MRCLAAAVVALLLANGISWAHDIPNARVDRSIQVDVLRGRILVRYEVSLSELTLTQDLRALIGELPGAERPGWFARYAEVTAPLNAKGFLIRVGKDVVELKVDEFKVEVDQHPKLTFRLSADLPESGDLLVRDTNYAASDGTSRLGIRAGPGVKLTGDELPSDVELIPIRPVWQLSDAEERRTREVRCVYESAPATVRSEESRPAEKKNEFPNPDRRSSSTLTSLLDRPVDGLAAWLGFGLAGILVGAAHSLQPGHGKTLAAAGNVVGDHPWRSALILSLSTTLTHMGAVLGLALLLWRFGGTDYAALQKPLLGVAGFCIAAAGLWRLGRILAPSSTESEPIRLVHRSTAGLVGLGVAAGLVPCWDAIGLIVISGAIGKPLLGLYLLAAFSLGMGIVLTGIAVLSARVTALDRGYSRPIQTAAACLLTVAGAWLLWS